jgi:putative MFS transporter
MWFLNLPTGLILIALSPLLPESARFLQRMGRGAEARRMLARFGAVAHAAPSVGSDDHSYLPPVNKQVVGLTSALTLAALAWGLVNFGLLLWLPGALVAEGRSVGAASALIAQSTLISLPVIVVSTYLYSAWSMKGSLLVMIGVMTIGLVGFLLRRNGVAMFSNPLPSLTLVIIGSCGVIAILLPYTTENYPLHFRGRATGWIAGCSKLGGLIAQCVSVVGAVPPFGIAALLVAIPSGLSLILIARVGRETRGRDLRDIDRGVASEVINPRDSEWSGTGET